MVQVKSYLMGNPDIKMALNENLTIGRQDGAQVRPMSRRSVIVFRLVGSVLSRICCKDVLTHARLAPSAHRSQALPCQRHTLTNWGLCSTVVLI